MYKNNIFFFIIIFTSKWQIKNNINIFLQNKFNLTKEEIKRERNKKKTWILDSHPSLFLLLQCDAFQKNKLMSHFWLISLELIYLHHIKMIDYILYIYICIENECANDDVTIKLCAWEFKLFHLTFLHVFFKNTVVSKVKIYIQTIFFRVFLENYWGNANHDFFYFFFALGLIHHSLFHVTASFFWVNTDDWQVEKIVNESFILNIVVHWNRAK